LNPLLKTVKTIVLILDQISDARNFGAIRTAECTGVNGIVQKAGSAPVNGDTVNQQEPCSIFLFVKWNTSKMLFSASERHKTVAATEKQIKLFMI
jgi:23S rRNA (guanosine2251-2'-O)-methyltransferase